MQQLVSRDIQGEIEYAQPIISDKVLMNLLGDSPRYFYAIRRNEDGELYLSRSDPIERQRPTDINLARPRRNF